MSILAIAARIGIGLLALAALVLAAWMVAAGPVTVLRVLRYGDTQIDDFLHYPARAMPAPARAYAFNPPERAAPEVIALGEGLPAADLDTLLGDTQTIAFLMLKDDRLVLERYYLGHSAQARSQSFSMAKSFTSTLVGLAIADGVFESADQPVTDFIPELAGRGFAGVTLRHLLAMTSGSSYVENDNPFRIHVFL